MRNPFKPVVRKVRDLGRKFGAWLDKPLAWRDVEEGFGKAVTAVAGGWVPIFFAVPPSFGAGKAPGGDFNAAAAPRAQPGDRAPKFPPPTPKP